MGVMTIHTGGTWMKLIGTISMHYPFIDDRTKTILESLVQKASDYSDFVRLLTNKTLKEKEGSLLPVLAFIHSRNLCYSSGLDALSREFIHLSLLKPFILCCKSCQTPNWDAVRKAVDGVLMQGLDDWLAVEMCILKIRAGLSISHWSSEEENAFDKILHLIRSNKSLSCYIPELCQIRSARHIDEANREMAIKSTLHGIELAESNDDPIRILSLYGQLAVLVEESDLHKSIEYLRKANIVFDTLGTSVLEATVLSHIGRLLSIRGEFNGALEAYIEAIRISDSLEVELGILPYSIAHIYNILGDGHEAHKWSKLALKSMSFSTRSLACTHTQMARALLQLGQPLAASSHLDQARELSQVEGNEAILALCSIAEGLINENEGLYDDAYQSYERAVEIIEQHKYPIELNDCALQLARLEVQKFSHGNEDDKDNYSTVWLDNLEENAREKDYPGILGIALLLKAELFFKQNRHSEAVSLVEEVGNIAQESSLSFLDDRIATLLSVVDQTLDADH